MKTPIDATSIFRLIGLLERLGIKSAIYTHSVEIREFASRYRRVR